MKNFYNIFFKKIKNFFSKKEVRIFFITLGLHILAVIFFALVQFGFLSNVGDHLFYFDSGKQISDLIRHGSYHWGDVYPHHWYPLFLGIVFTIFGKSIIFGTLINAFLASVSAVLFYRILRESSVSEKIAYYGSLIVLSGYASYMYHSSMLLKEAWIVALLLGIAYASIRLASGKGNRIILFGVILIMFILLRSLRFFIGFAAIIGVLTNWFVNAAMPFTQKCFRGLAMILCVTAIGIVLRGDKVIGSMTTLDALHFDFIQKTRHEFFTGGSTTTNIQIIKKIDTQPNLSQSENEKPGLSQSEDEKTATYKFSVSGFAMSFANSVFGPFPWQLSIGKYIPLLSDIIFIYLLMISSILGIVYMKRKQLRTIAPWLISAGIIILAVSIGTDNLGAVVRQRMPGFIIIGLIAVFSVDYLFMINTFQIILKLFKKVHDK